MQFLVIGKDGNDKCNVKNPWKFNRTKEFFDTRPAQKAVLSKLLFSKLCYSKGSGARRS